MVSFYRYHHDAHGVAPALARAWSGPPRRGRYRAFLAHLDGRSRATRRSPMPVRPRRREVCPLLTPGLLRCGRCGGHRMTVSYHDGSGSAYGYTCGFYQVNYGTGGRCQHIAGPALDAYVTGQVLDAVAPAALEVSMAAAAQAEGERAMLDKLWRQRLERARYAAGRARRQYQLAEPENRLVARQLEADWEAALAEAGQLEADYQRFTEEQPAALSPAERAAIQALAADLPQVWHAPSTTQADRKELLRILIQDITVNVAGDSELVDVTITWPAATRPPGRPSAQSPAWTSCPITPRSWPASPGSPPRAATAGRSPMSSTPRDSGRPSGPAGSATSRSVP